jgi:phage terminase small subunit
VGAGRKPKAKTSRPVADTPTNLVAFEGGKATPADGNLSAIPPADLPADHRDFWHRYAGQAITARTLTERTVAAFRLLCELDAELRVAKVVIEHDGRTYIKVTIDGAGQEHQELKAHPLTGSYRQLAQRVEALLARFGLAPFGKPVESAAKKATANPWARIVAK